MTGENVLNRAAALLGYSDFSGNSVEKTTELLNQIYSDLWRIKGKGLFIPLNNVSSDIELPERVVNDVMPYGVAMLIAGSREDAAGQNFYSALYAQKRAAMSITEKIMDVMPKGEGL